MSDSLIVVGSPASPYTRKLIAALHYRRIAFSLLNPASTEAQGLPAPRVRLLPTVYLPGEAGTPLTDSTPILRRLETDFTGRGLVPADPALRFLNELLEDYADEWLTKAMFHYRWSYPDDIAKAGRVIAALGGVSRSDAALDDAAAVFSARQIGRLGVVGSTAATGPLIEESYRRFLIAFDAHLAEQPFLFGRAPTTGDFAVFGQLSQLAAFDPTPMALTTEIAPRVCAWTLLMEDLSGHEGAIGGADALSDQPETLEPLLAEMGRVFTPVMLANARALMAGEAEVRAEIDGRPWTQTPFPYQAKTLGWLRASYAALPDESRTELEPLLKRTGLQPLFD